MHILVIHDGTNIKCWLVGEPAEAAETHLRNGYPHLLADWEAGSLTAVVVEVAAGEQFRPDMYEVVDNLVGRRA